MLVCPLHLKVLAVTLDLSGYDSSAVVRLCGLNDPAALDGPDWIDVEVFDRMMVAALEESMDPSFALQAAFSPAMALYSPIFNLVMYAPSIRQALQDIRRFSPLVMERPEVELVEDGERTRIVLRPLGASPTGLRFRTEFITVGMVQLLRLTARQAQDIRGVYFPFDCPEHSHRYPAVLGPRISFGQPECAIYFNPELLERPHPGHHEASYLMAATQAESALAAAQSRTGIADRVRGMLLRRFPIQPPAAQVAEEFGLSERSLRRHLAAAGVGFAQLQEECLRIMAERHLADRRQSIKQVSQELGFASVTSFHRAFRRWTGMTPAGWRERGSGA